jgi:D-lactate dehydrogenase (cytochrome)
VAQGHNCRVNRAVARPARVVPVELSSDTDVVARYLEDAAHYPGGRALAVARPHNIDELASAIKQADHVLAVGAQSSLTGGATPSGDVVLSTERLSEIRVLEGRVVAGAGAKLQDVQTALAAHQAWLPPVPTFLGATVGGAVSTNAAGAATFKYGSIRNWVESITVVLASGDILSIARGDVLASDDGEFLISTSAGDLRLEVPRITMPDVPKRSAGYYAAPGMDLVDLFVGAEGTLGIIVEATLRVQPRPAGTCWAMVPLSSEALAIELAGDLREASRQTWDAKDPNGIDLAAIEHIDRRSLDVVREDGVDRRLQIALPAGTDVVLLAQLELTKESAARDLWSDLSEARESGSEETPLNRFCRLLDRHGALESTEISMPADTRRAAAFVELRESVPAGVNRRVALARAQDGRVHKTAADMIVPYRHFGRMIAECRRLCEASHLDLAVWGHISDGNVHPNVIPRSYEDVELGRRMLLELARQVIVMGGCPLAEHGVGRNPVKQQMLQLLYGAAGVDAMRRMKLSLDPSWKLASGVLFHKGVGSNPTGHLSGSNLELDDSAGTGTKWGRSGWMAL